MINTILIANRGEIACRVIRTCRRLGIRTVAIYSDADTHARHVRMADEAIHVGPSPSSESYLVIDAVIGAARRSGADAIHPGFGFLAENSDFAQACADAGLVFIGPTPAAIAAMGNKHAARDLVARVGVPILPGYGGADQSEDRLQREAEHIGWPLMVKAAAGGGGKGMRLVPRLADLHDACVTARREAQQAFGSDELILERALITPRHIEFQIFGDQHGNLIHLGERECSIQRRHQKVIEESPSVALTAALREAMGTAAVAAARTVNYSNAGTVEFLLDHDGTFYFLEINTRLQVEHPVTECVTGLDLVEWQIRVAEGELLPLCQEGLRLNGSAMEVRLYAENPANDFLPVTGEILLWREPEGEGIRVENGIQSGDQVSIYYDPMLAKIIAYGSDRAAACRRLLRALETTTLLGLTSNRSYVYAVLNHPVFQAGELSTAFLADYFADWTEPVGDIPLALIAVTLAQWLEHSQLETNRGYWRNNPNRPQLYRYAVSSSDEPVDVYLTPACHNSTYRMRVAQDAEVITSVEFNEQASGEMVLTVDGHRQRVMLAHAGNTWWVQVKSGEVQLHTLELLPEPKAPADAGGSLRAPMPGVVLAILVEVGQRVQKGDALLKLEAMKMEHTIRTAADGVVETIYFAPGDTVAADTILVQLKEIEG
ncbi:MAG TPA: 3-methylcrotonyl-CoA carboxylase [Ktedonobacter sp.]|nr:3-methylcrotonyl-CoA carboxylase [Ktedonobacter sp.]